MNIYEELDPIAFKGKRKHIVKVNMPDIAYPSQHIDIEISRGSRDQVIIPDTVKITFNLDITSTDKAHSVGTDVGRALVKKRVLMLGSKEIDMINNSDISDTGKDLYLSEKRCEERLLQGIQPANSLKTRVGAKKADGTALLLTTQENAVKKSYDNQCPISLDFDFSKHPIYHYGLSENLTVRLELNSSEKIILCTGDTSET